MSDILVLMQIPTVAMVLYLDVLTVAALRRRKAPPATEPAVRFAVVVPAHNEEAALPALLCSLDALDYPAELYDVHIVADNCVDATAEVARAAGACVHERHDDRQRGKGYALQWLLASLRSQGTAYDAYVFVDADSIVSPNLLTVMSAHLARGEQAIQVYYGVLNRDESWQAALRDVAFCLFNGLRPRGRATLGLSAGLRGNGMCFTAAIIERLGWEAFTLAEDAEFHLQLVDAGIAVAFAPEARVISAMPASLRRSGAQNTRWERGRLQLVRRYGPRLLLTGLRQRDPLRLEAIAEQIVPPFSLLTATVALTVVITWALRAPAARRLATLTMLGQICYVVAGLRLAGAGPRTYAALLWAPLYAAWKVWIYALAAAGIHNTRWVRTERAHVPAARPHDSATG